LGIIGKYIMNSNKIKYLKINKSIMEGIEIKQCIRKEQSYKKHVHKELLSDLLRWEQQLLSLETKVIDLKKMT